MSQSGRDLRHKSKQSAKLLDPEVLIDEIIRAKGPHKYQDGLHEDTWEEELERIPLFMTKVPDVIDPLTSPAIAALQDFKYEEDSSEAARALALKEDGNEWFKMKQYKKAVIAYSEGIKLSLDEEINAVLYANRAAAHFHLGNYRSSLSDATHSKELNPNHLKAFLRGALCCMELERFGEAVQWCDEGLKVEGENTKLKDLRSKATKGKKQQERDERKLLVIRKQEKQKETQLLKVIQSRGVHLAESSTEGNEVDEQGFPTLQLAMTGPHPSGARVHLDNEGTLVWPVLFLYPEYGLTDFVSAFHENHRFLDHVQQMFDSENRPPWDKDGKYTLNAIELYFEDRTTGEYVPVNLESTLATILSTPRCVVQFGTPAFVVLSNQTTFHDAFLNHQT